MYKFIFALLGFQLLGLFGAFLGDCIGSSIDRARVYGIGGVKPLGKPTASKSFIRNNICFNGKTS